jgi:hypothetical protein
MWHASTLASGKMTAHPAPGTRHSYGMSGVAHTIMPAMSRVARMSDTRKRFRIAGISFQKFERSTSFFVAAHVMLYENRCASTACEIGIESPPKKKKLQADVSGCCAQRKAGDEQEGDPEDVRRERGEQALLPEAVLEEREADVARAEEDDGGGEVDLERVHVEAVDRELEPEEHVVDDADRDRRRDTVCSRPSANTHARGDDGAGHAQYENM